MVTFVKGDIFRSPAQVITNTINCVGVMGAGLALEFKKRYPILFEDYRQRFESGTLKPGIPYLFSTDDGQILNFPTKRHWKDNSRLEDIQSGLTYLANNFRELGIYSLALPPLGCGLGGLNWAEVRTLIVNTLGPVNDLDVFVYEPVDLANQIPGEGERIKMPRAGGQAAASDSETNL